MCLRVHFRGKGSHFELSLSNKLVSFVVVIHIWSRDDFLIPWRDRTSQSGVYKVVSGRYPSTPERDTRLCLRFKYIYKKRNNVDFWLCRWRRAADRSVKVGRQRVKTWHGDTFSCWCPLTPSSQGPTILGLPLSVHRTPKFAISNVNRVLGGGGTGNKVPRKSSIILGKMSMALR